MSERTDPNIRRPTGPIEVVSEEQADGSFEIKLEAKDAKPEEAPAARAIPAEGVPQAFRLPAGEGGGVAAYIGLVVVLVLLGAGAYLLFVSPHQRQPEPPLATPDPGAAVGGEMGAGQSEEPTLQRSRSLRVRENTPSLRRSVLAPGDGVGSPTELGGVEDREAPRLLRQRRLESPRTIGSTHEPGAVEDRQLTVPELARPLGVSGRNGRVLVADPAANAARLGRRERPDPRREAREAAGVAVPGRAPETDEGLILPEGEEPGDLVLPEGEVTGLRGADEWAPPTIEEALEAEALEEGALTDEELLETRLLRVEALRAEREEILEEDEEGLYADDEDEAEGDDEAEEDDDEDGEGEGEEDDELEEDEELDGESPR